MFSYIVLQSTNLDANRNLQRLLINTHTLLWQLRLQPLPQEAVESKMLLKKAWLV